MTAVLDPPRPRTEAPLRRRVTAHGVAAAAIGWAMWSLAGQDGGVDLRDAVRATAPLLAAIPAAAGGVAGLPRRWGLVVAVACLGLIASLGFAGYRADAVAPLLTYSAMLTAGLATVAVFRRPWGPGLMTAIGIAAGARLWWIGLEGWYGSSLSVSAADRWMPLPWHNQSGIAMAVLALILAGAAMSRSRWAPVAGAGAALAAAAVYLSASRGSMVALGVGMAVAVAATSDQWRRWLLLAAASVLAVGLLTNLPGAATPQAGESLTAADSSSARVAHWQAAGSMFLDRPLVGHGVGSYRLASTRWADGDVNPTSHAHSEYIEFFAEGGLLLGLPMGLLVAGMGMAALAGVRRGVGRHRLVVVMGSAAWVTLAVHAAIDFDWLFPILGLGFAISGGIAVGALGPPPKPANSLRWPVAAVSFVLAAALGAGFVEGFRREPGAVHPPWNVDAAAAVAERALEGGDVERAVEIAQSAAAWNPDDARPGLLEEIARLDIGDASAADVAEAARAGRPGMGLRLDAANRLVERGFVVEARQLVTEVIEEFSQYPGWNLGGLAAVAYRLDVDIEGRLYGCAGAEAAAAAAEAVELANAMGTEDYTAQARRYCS